MKKTLAVLLVFVMLMALVPSGFAEPAYINMYTETPINQVAFQLPAGITLVNPADPFADYSGDLPPGIGLALENNTIKVVGTPPAYTGNYLFTVNIYYYDANWQQGVTALDLYCNVLQGAGNNAPTFTYQPNSQTGNAGGSLTFSAGTINATSVVAQIVDRGTGVAYDQGQIKNLTGADTSFTFLNNEAVLTLYNITDKLNNYAIRFIAYNGTNTAQSYDAYMTVSGGTVNITKHPGDETLDDGGSAIFIAAADNVYSMVWQLYTANGSNMYELPAGTNAVPGLSAKCYQDQTGRFICELYNVTGQMDGYYVKAVFAGSDNQPVYSNQAFLHVNKKELATPMITVQPKGATVKEENQEVTLNVSARATEGTLMYEWYSSESSSLGTMQTTGVKGSTFKVPKATKSMYYACAVWTEQNGVKSAQTWSVPVEVKYEVQATPSPTPEATPSPSPDPNASPSPSPTPAGKDKTVRKGPGLIIVLLLFFVAAIIGCLLFLFKDKLWPKDDEEIYVCSNCGWVSKPGKSPPTRCPVCKAPLEFEDDED